MPQHAPDPLEALGRLAGRWQARRPERTPLEKALGRRLATPLAIPQGRSREGPPRSTLNGYALKPGMGAGEYLYRVAGVEGSPRTGEPHLERVETGDPLPPGTERVVPVEWTVVVASSGGGPPRVRIPEEALPPSGHGVAGPGDLQAVDAGTRIVPRLLALLLDRGISSVETCAALRIGILTIGSELTDIQGEAPSGSARDLSGFWLPLLVRSLGHLPHPLGIAGDEPAEGREAFLRARRLRLDALIVTGGLGDGSSDRTAELILRTGGQVAFDRVSIRPGRRCLSGETMEMKVLGLGGPSLEASAAFDLFVRPLLLSAQGAPPASWDWSLKSFPVSALRDRPEAPPPKRRSGSTGTPPWSAIPVRRDPVKEGFRAIPCPDSLFTFLPWIPGQSGWAILPPAGIGHPREGTVFFQACEAGESGPWEEDR